MRRTSMSLLIVLLFALYVVGCAQAISPTSTMTAPAVLPTSIPSGPDLLILSFTLHDSKWTGFGGFQATVEVVIKNVGDEPASAFEVGIVGVNRENRGVRFYFSYDPALTAGLAPRQEVTFVGETGLSWHGNFDVTCMDDEYKPTQCAMHDKNTLWLMAIVDYCIEEDNCAVEETNEVNNSRGPVIVVKPGK